MCTLRTVSADDGTYWSGRSNGCPDTPQCASTNGSTNGDDAAGHGNEHGARGGAAADGDEAGRTAAHDAASTWTARTQILIKSKSIIHNVSDNKVICI